MPFAWPLILPFIKPRGIAKEFQQKAIQFNGTFHVLKTKNSYFIYISITGQQQPLLLVANTDLILLAYWFWSTRTTSRIKLGIQIHLFTGYR